MTDDASLATWQRSMAEEGTTYPWFPPLTRGCPETSTDEIQYPVEVDYEYGAVDPTLFEAPLADGLDRWAPLLPPLANDGLGEGNTPRVAITDLADRLGLDADLYVKDESANPTWSHKDRFNRAAVSAAVECDAAGVAVASSGNHGASAAAYAAAADLPCVVLTGESAGSTTQQFLSAYGAAVLRVDDWDARRRAVDRLADEHGFHPVSTRTRVPTGHPFGAEGYKTIAYELFAQLGTVPGMVFVPTGFAELLYGTWKGFRELRELGITGETPRMVACEPASRAPLAAAMESERPVADVDSAPTDAASIRATTSSYRGKRALVESNGYASPADDGTITSAQRQLANHGLWQEFSGAAGVAGLQAAIERGDPVDGPVVCLATSSGFKDGETAEVPEAEPTWERVRDALVDEYGLAL